MQHKTLAMNVHCDKLPTVPCERLRALAIDDVSATRCFLKTTSQYYNQPHVRLIFRATCTCEVIEIMRAFVDRQQLVQLCNSLWRHAVGVVDWLQRRNSNWR